MFEVLIGESNLKNKSYFNFQNSSWNVCLSDRFADGPVASRRPRADRLRDFLQSRLHQGHNVGAAASSPSSAAPFSTDQRSVNKFRRRQNRYRKQLARDRSQAFGAKKFCSEFGCLGNEAHASVECCFEDTTHSRAFAPISCHNE